MPVESQEFSLVALLLDPLVMGEKIDEMTVNIISAHRAMVAASGACELR